MNNIELMADENKWWKSKNFILSNLVLSICLGINLEALANPQFEMDSQGSNFLPSGATPQQESPSTLSEGSNLQQSSYSIPSSENESNPLLSNINENSLQGSPYVPTMTDQDSLSSQFTVESNREILSQSSLPSEQVEYTFTPLQLFPFEPMNLETANVIPAGSIYTIYGANVFSKGEGGGGTGSQVYYISIDGGVSDQFQLGLAFMLFDDPLPGKINGQVTNLSFISYAPKFKYQFVNEPSYRLALTGSLELLKIASENRLFNSSDNFKSGYSVGGTLQVPFTYNLTENAQWHLVGGLAFFSDTINDGGDFYGTFFNIGTGFSFRFDERFGFFADLNVPLGPGGNSVNKNGNIKKNVVWSAGFNYLHSPAVGIDISATNSLGATPATQLLTFIPDGGQVAVGLNVRYTPDIGNNYPANFAQKPLAPLSARDKQFLVNGITLTSSETLRAGMFSLDGGAGAGATFQIGYGMSDDAQLEFVGQQLGDSDRPIGNAMKLGAATKLRFLNQAEGDPFSFSIRGGIQDSATEEDGTGSFTAEASFLYQLNSQIAFTFNPKAGFFGSSDIVGTGFGINYQPLPGFQLMGEVTPILTGETTVWAAGVRYMHPEINLGLGVYGSNAAGTHDIGSVIAQSNSNVSVGFNVFWLLGP
jgi:hypothetical protein